MNREEAADIIDALARCLKNDTNQYYHVEVTLLGTQIQASAPGATGMSITAIGGSGGSVVGAELRQQIGNVEIEFAHRQADEQILAQIDAAANILSEISTELKAPAPDKEELGSRLGRLSALAVPSIMIEIVRLILRLSLGMQL